MSKKRLKKKYWRDAGNDQRCVICGKLLWSGLDNYVQGRSGAVCLSCLRAGVDQGKPGRDHLAEGENK